MAIWEGNGFNSTYTSGIFKNPSTNFYYYYDQNYNGLFPLTSSDGINFNYTSNTYAPVIIKNGTTLNQITVSTQVISSIASQILFGRLNLFKKSATNVLNAYTQNPSSFLTSTITQSLSGANISTSLSTYAPFLISVQANFSLTDALNNWVNGPELVQGLSNILTSYQSVMQTVQQSVQRITDFKNKLIKQQVVLADEIRKIQGLTDSFLASATFTPLASAFSNEFGPLQNIIGNSNNAFSIQLSGVLPTSGLDPGSAIENIINGLYQRSVKPAIINPIDKIIVDINNLQNFTNSVSFLSQFAITGFENLSEQQNFTNQAVNLLNNIVSKIPIASELPITASTTNPTTINIALTNYKNNLLNSNQSLSTSQNAVKNLLNIMQTVAPVQQTSKTVNALSGSKTIIPNDPFSGGSFANLNIIKTTTNVAADQSIVPPNITQSPDPEVASNQLSQSITQSQANQPGVNQTFVAGSGINILTEIPLRPRNIHVDGSLGDYNVIQGIQI